MAEFKRHAKRFLHRLQGLSEEDVALLAQARDVLGKAEHKRLKTGVMRGETKLKAVTLSLPGVKTTYPHITGAERELNGKLRDAAYAEAYKRFAPHAFEEVWGSIAPNILDMESVKRAAALQLFADERMHILLLGDPGTGKTEILRSAAQFAEKSSMGLGSGTSKAGLSVSYARGELHKGLLLQADGGLCCIDELNLMQKEDRAALYNAMEKGFVTFDKGGRSETFSADVRVLATANPKGDRFKGEDVEALKKQLPFDPALVSRFHLVFLIRKPDLEEFVNIAKKIVRDGKRTASEKEFLKAYVQHARAFDVEFPKALEKQVTDAARRIKEHEDEVLVEISPRIVKGIIGFSKASARCELRTKAEKRDVDRVLRILGDSLGLELLQES